jgi:hypothetical protein
MTPTETLGLAVRRQALIDYAADCETLAMRTVEPTTTELLQEAIIARATVLALEAQA